jgi:hypothetical protein
MKGLAGVFLVALAPATFAREATLPVPPIPPIERPRQAAPVPDPNIVYPDHDGRRFTVTLDSKINHREAPDPGLAFAPGAHYQLDDDRRAFVLPGLMVHVPVP